jgi:hypothetical protein
LKNLREKKMRRTALVSLIALALLLGLSGCGDWSTDATVHQTTEGNATGLYTVYQGELPFYTLNLWQEGNSLKGQDSRGLIWHGQTGGDLSTVGSAGFQIYLECVNQRTGLTEWMRGSIALGSYTYTILVDGEQQEQEIEAAIFEGVYTRSDGAETSAFYMLGPGYEPRWGEEVEET